MMPRKSATPKKTPSRPEAASPVTAAGTRIPNVTTRKALHDAEAGRGMTDYSSVDEMFDHLDLCINQAKAKT